MHMSIPNGSLFKLCSAFFITAYLGAENARMSVTYTVYERQIEIAGYSLMFQAFLLIFRYYTAPVK